VILAESALYGIYYLHLGANSPALNTKTNGLVLTRTPVYEVATNLEFRLVVKQGICTKDWEGDLEWPEQANE